MADLRAFVLQLKERLRVSDIVGRRVALRRRGREWIGLSPFNKEKTPSFTVNDDKGFWHCFSSGKHGDAISFLQETEHLTFMEALEKVASTVGMSLPAMTPKESQQTQQLDTLRITSQHVTTVFQQFLRESQGTQARRYLQERGLSQDILERYHIGYVPRNFVQVLQRLKACSQEALVTLGILKEGKKGLYVPIAGRIFFPIHDRRGHPIAWGARVLQNDQGKYAKYLNAPEHPLFKKRACLYGQNFMQEREKPLVVVEGYMDVLALAQAGHQRVVASMGTSLTQEQLGMLWREHNEPIICFDGDAAGKRAMKRLIEVALPLLGGRRTLKFRFVPMGKDPDLVIQQGGLKAFEDLKTTPFVDVLYTLVRLRLDRSSPESRVRCFERLEDYVNAIKNKEMRYHYRHILRQKIWGELRKQTKAQDSLIEYTPVPEDFLLKLKELRLLLGVLTVRPDMLLLLSQASQHYSLEGLSLEGDMARYRDILLTYGDDVNKDAAKDLLHAELERNFSKSYKEHRDIVKSVYPHIVAMETSPLLHVCASLLRSCYLLSLREHYKDLVEDGVMAQEHKKRVNSMISTIEAEEAKIIKEERHMQAYDPHASVMNP